MNKLGSSRIAMADSLHAARTRNLVERGCGGTTLQVEPLRSSRNRTFFFWTGVLKNVWLG